MFRLRKVLAGAFGVLFMINGTFTAGANAVKTTRISVSRGTREANGYSAAFDLSRDGRKVAFESTANNLVPGDNNEGFDIFVRNLARGRTKRVSVRSNGKETRRGYNNDPDISDNGRLVVFQSSHALVESDDNNAEDIYIYSLRASRISRVSVSSNERESMDPSFSPRISATGRYVTFISEGQGFLPPGDHSDVWSVFLRDRRKGTTELISGSIGGGPGNRSSHSADVAPKGRYVLFESSASNLVPEDTNELDDVFVRDLLTNRTKRVNVNSKEEQSETVEPSTGPGDSGLGGISRDGKIVVFSSAAGNLVSGDTSEYTDVFVRNRRRGTTKLISRTSSGKPGDGDSYRPEVSADGSRIAVFFLRQRPGCRRSESSL